MRNPPPVSRRRSVLEAGPVILLVLLMAVAVFAQDLPRHSVPFTLLQNHLVVAKGSLGPEQDLNFLIDTGASCTYLGRDLAHRLSLVGPEKTSVTYGKKVTTQQVILREFFLGTARFHTVPARVIAIAERLPQVGARIDVIVGLNALMRTGLTIDYDRRLVIFGAAPGFENSAVLETTREAIVAQFDIDGKSLRMMVDTGAPLVLLYQRRLPKEMPRQRVPVEKTLYHLGARETLNGVLLSGVRLGGSRWERLEAFLLNTPVDGYESLQGVLGPRSLGLARIHFDFKEKRVSWEREG